MPIVNGKLQLPCSHDEAMDLIISASSTTALSYDEMIAVYLRARGILNDGAQPLASPIPPDWYPEPGRTEV